MEMVLVGAAIGLTCTILFLVFGGRYDHFGLTGLGVVMGFLTFCVSIGLVICGFQWEAAQYKADIINREYNTSYTRQEIFYADDVIDTIRQINRQRLEVKGSVELTGEKSGN